MHVHGLQASSVSVDPSKIGCDMNRSRTTPMK